MLDWEEKDYLFCVGDTNQVHSNVMKSEHETIESLDETSKKGSCWYELRRVGLLQWGDSRQVKLMDHQGQSAAQQSSSIVKEEYEIDDKKAVKIKYSSFSELGKRKCVTYNRRNKDKAASQGKQAKRQNPLERWSAERIKTAQGCLFEILKSEGAVFGNAIARPALRTAARKRIGDTGLLDHLLKHIDGKVEPSGTERFRRCYNTVGVMEYWLESPDLVDLRKEAGVSDPNWVPPSWWKPGMGLIQESVPAGEVKVLREEIDKMKRDMQELLSKQQEKDQTQSILNEEIRKELMKWKSKTDNRMMEMSKSLACMQDVNKQLVIWKAGTEKQLAEISNVLSSLQASNQCAALSPSTSERWEDWLESTNLDNLQGGDIASWLEVTGGVEFGQAAPFQNPCLAPASWSKPVENLAQALICSQEMDLIKNDIPKTNSYVQEVVVPSRQEEDIANVTPDSSVTDYSKLDLDTSVVPFQEKLKELLQWKAKTELQLLELSNAISTIQSSRN